MTSPNDLPIEVLLNLPMEAECKYRVVNLAETQLAFAKLEAVFVGREEHCDTYLRHPTRDFRETDEALRIREVNGQPFMTYKGPRLAGPIKIRPEIELPIVEGTVPDWLKIWQQLGFTVALAVRKTRDVFRTEFNSRSMTITLDHVAELGDFVEIERIVMHGSEIEAAQQDIQAIAKVLHLHVVIQQSYLGMMLEKIGQ